MALPQPQIPQQQHHHARQLSRLNINAASFNPGGPESALFTPHGFPTVGPQSAFAFSGNPMQQQQQHLQRQIGHHGSQPSMSLHRSRPSLANIPGFMPPMSGVPMTAGPQMANFNVNGFPVPPTPGGSQQQFPSQPPHQPHFRQRRQQSISIGGPPRAALGGPQRKATTPSPAAPTSTVLEGKLRKVVVKLPKETAEDEPTEEDQQGNAVASSSRSRPTWARYPIPPDSLPEQPAPVPPQITSVEIYPSHLPEEEGDSADSAPAATVVLPRRNAWDVYRKNIIEEKLAKLGVEPSGFPGLGPAMPIRALPPQVLIHHHNRASSISTPADPALLARHAMQGNRQTPSPLSVAPPLSAVPTQSGASSSTESRPLNALAPPFTFGGQAPAPLAPSPRFQQASTTSGPRGFHGHSMSLATPAFNPPNPYLSSGFGLGSTNPFGRGATLGDGSQGGPSLSVSPQPGTLASVSEYEEEEEAAVESSIAAEGPKIHAPKPLGMLHLRPVFVSHQSSPAPSSAPEIRDDGNESAARPSPPVAAAAAAAQAKDLSTADFMRGFGIESDLEADANEEGVAEEEVSAEPSPQPGLGLPIVGEVERDLLIAAEDSLAGPTPTASRFPTDAATAQEEEEAIEEAVKAVDPAEDADEEDVSSERGDEVEEPETEPEDVAEDNYTTPSHSRHVSKVSMAPSLAEMGPAAVAAAASAVAGGRAGMREFRFGGGVREEEGEDMEEAEQDGGEEAYLNEVEVPATEGWTGRLVSDDETESIGEWSNPSDEERARQEKIHRRLLREQAKVTSQDLSGFVARPTQPYENHDLTIRSEQSFVSNPSNDPRQSDEIISNPSDDEYAKAGMTFGGGILASQREPSMFAQIGADFNPVVQRPLPPLPHSRNTSAQFPQAAASPSSHHHSPAPSTHTATPVIKSNIGQLNPLARPFVFGARPGSDSFSLQSPSTAPGTIPLPNSAGLHKPSHSRQLSVTSKLNIAAPEFKPGGAFIFTPIEGVPRLPMPAPGDENETSRPLPQVPTSGSSYSLQGREKRQKLDQPKESPKAASFQFPRPWSPSQDGDVKAAAHVPEPSAPLDSSRPSLNIHAKPFTFAGLTGLKAEAPIRALTLPESKSEQQSPSRGPSPDPEAAQRAMSMPTSTLASPPRPEQELPGATSAFGRPSPRPPIPDFTHPTSSNTVPAGLFKALHNDADGPTRPTVRSRLASRDFFEHANRRSLDDINVPLISKKMASKVPAPAPSVEPVFALPLPEPSAPALALAPPPRAKERRSSAPAQQPVVEVRAPSPAPSVSPSITSSIVRDSGEAVEQFEGRMEELLDDKISQLREDIASLASTKTKDADDLVNTAIGQLVASFRAQMMDYMKKVTETNMSRADAHVELNHDLIKAAIEEGHEAIRASVLQEIERLQTTQRPGPPMEVLHAIEDLRSVVAESTSSATQTLLAHVDTAETFAQRRLQENHQLLLRELSSLILPRLAAIRPEPLDLDAITEQLAEAVKPHISQLIDLASDKKETAVLITQQLSPLLHAIMPRFDLDTMARQIAMDVAQINPATDPHVLKEEVADLVIERLDARLSIRDSTFSPDAIATRVSKIVGPLNDLTNIPSASSVEALNTRQETLLQQSTDLMTRQGELAERLADVPDNLAAASKALDQAKTDLEEKSKWLSELEEVKKLASANAELQTQLSKARSAHGQVRSEKDLMAERLQSAEQERDRMKAELEALKAAAASRDAELKDAQMTAARSEAALAQALERVTAANADKEEMKERANRFEEKNQQAQTEIQQLSVKVKDLEVEAKQTASEKDIALQVQARLEAEVETLRGQSQHWDDLRRTAEQVELLSQLIGAADSEEVTELRRIRDRHRILEKEYNSLEKRCAEQEAKIASLQRTTASNKQIIAQTQQRATEWEKRARTAEGELESTQTELEQARDIQHQLETDLNTVKDELENANAALAISNDQEQELQVQVASLESRLSTLRNELKEARSLKPPMQAPKPQSAGSSPWRRPIAVPNGRPGSRASTVRDETRPGTSTPNGRQSPSPPDTPPAQQDLWASIHAPKRQTAPVARPRHSTPVKAQLARNRVASPTPSVVSVAATEREDGWWS